MTSPRISACVFALLVAESVPAQEKLSAGQEGKLDVPGYSFPCRLRVPKDYKAGRRWPLLLFLHGSGGEPTTWPWRQATKSKGYLIVGLSYAAVSKAAAYGITSDKKTRLGMHAFIERVRAQVDKVYGVDQKYVILSGLSMGGWGVNHYGFLEEARGRYRGYAIIAAGIAGGVRLELSVLAGLPLLLLNGEKDPNLVAANRGKPQFEKAGADLEQVILPGEPHVPSVASMSPHLAAWLAKLQREDAAARAIAAIQWQSSEIEPLSDTAEHGLAALVAESDGMKNLNGAKPVLVYFYSSKELRNKPSSASKVSAKVDLALFSFPVACPVPVASRFFDCIRIDVGALDKKTSPLLHEGHAPLVLLYGKDKSFSVKIAKGSIREASLFRAMLPLLAEGDAAIIDARVAAIRPILRDLKQLDSKRAAIAKKIEKMKKRQRKNTAKKLKVQRGLLDALNTGRDALEEKLRNALRSSSGK